VTFEGVELQRLRQRELRRMRGRMQMVFQDPRSSLDSRMTAAAQVAEPLELKGDLGRQQRRDRVTELLEMVGFDPQSASRYPHEFSGGQQQRVGIARALASGRSVCSARSRRAARSSARLSVGSSWATCPGGGSSSSTSRQAFDQFEHRSSVRTWMYRIATNASLSALGRNRRGQHLFNAADGA
jgi:hypothetical protein